MPQEQQHHDEQPDAMPEGTKEATSRDATSIEDLQCPKCAHKGSFLIEASRLVLIEDPGLPVPCADPYDWNARSYCRCDGCGHPGTVLDFHPASTAAPVKELYYVGIREVHVRHFNVMASSPDEAKDLVAQSAPEAVDLEELEYSHEQPRDTWDAYAIPVHPAPQPPACPQQL